MIKKGQIVVLAILGFNLGVSANEVKPKAGAKPADDPIGACYYNKGAIAACVPNVTQSWCSSKANSSFDAGQGCADEQTTNSRVKAQATKAASKPSS